MSYCDNSKKKCCGDDKNALNSDPDCDQCAHDLYHNDKFSGVSYFSDDGNNCYPGTTKGEGGTSTYCKCVNHINTHQGLLTGGITIQGVPQSCQTCYKKAKSESYISCCASMPYSNLKKTWSTQKPYTL
jgi:hypothetical protein